MRYYSDRGGVDLMGLKPSS